MGKNKRTCVIFSTIKISLKRKQLSSQVNEESEKINARSRTRLSLGAAS